MKDTILSTKVLTAEDLANNLLDDTDLSYEQAHYVAFEVYQPLYDCIRELAMIVDHFDKREFINTNTTEG